MESRALSKLCLAPVSHSKWFSHVPLKVTKSSALIKGIATSRAQATYQPNLMNIVTACVELTSTNLSNPRVFKHNYLVSE